MTWFDSAPSTTGTITLTVNGVNTTYTVPTSQTTPTQFTISYDCSSLTDGVLYDVIVKMASSGGSAIKLNLSKVSVDVVSD